MRTHVAHAVVSVLACFALAACSSSPEPTKPAQPTKAKPVQTKPADPQPPETPPPATAPKQPAPAGVRLTVEPSPTQVKAGNVVTLTVYNRGNKELRYMHPGGSNGCAAFSWQVFLETKESVFYSQTPPRNRRVCTMAIVPPRQIVIPAGGAGGTITLRTGGAWYADDSHASSAAANMPKHKPGNPLPPGVYRVVVNGLRQKAKGVLSVGP